MDCEIESECVDYYPQNKRVLCGECHGVRSANYRKYDKVGAQKIGKGNRKKAEPICKSCAGALTPENHGIGTGPRCRPCLNHESKVRNRLRKENAPPLSIMCAVCHEKPQNEQLSLDHDHATDEFRGYLCQPCNLMIGNAREKISYLQAGINYLADFEAARTLLILASGLPVPAQSVCL